MPWNSNNWFDSNWYKSNWWGVSTSVSGITVFGNTSTVTGHTLPVNIILSQYPILVVSSSGIAYTLSPHILGTTPSSSTVQHIVLVNGIPIVKIDLRRHSKIALKNGRVIYKFSKNSDNYWISVRQGSKIRK